MIHLNPIARKRSGSIFWLLEVMVGYPPFYLASSIQDFIDDRHQVEIYRSYVRTQYPGKAMVIFTNTRLSLVENGYELSDLTNKILVQPGKFSGLLQKSHSSVRPERISERRYYHLTIAYNLQKDFSYLFSAQQFGPPQASSQPSLQDLISALEPA